MRFYLGVTDTNWFQYLRALQPEDINFWQPSGRPLRGLERGEPFLFKLKAPYRKIGGVAFFSAFAAFPLGIAWDAFGQRNGCATRAEFRSKIMGYREKNGVQPDPTETVGCIILTDPVLFEDHEMIDLPAEWDEHTVTGKFFNSEERAGARIWEQIQERLKIRRFLERPAVNSQQPAVGVEGGWREVAARVRTGQGAFRVLVTEAYGRACSVTGDHTLPVLEAAHIKPYADAGPHQVSNGLLLRADLHKLFDDGYLTVTTDYHIEVSKAIREQFHNGRVYYDLHGKPLAILPERMELRPSVEFLSWHNQNVFKAS
ncbi:MAG: HNH endonuclease [Spirochaetota bacterium]